MSLNNLLNHLERMPMLKVLVPFCIGILLYDSYTLPYCFLIVALIVVGVVTLLMHTRVGLLLFIVLSGFTMAQLRAPSVSVPRDIYTTFCIDITAIPSDRGSYSSVDGSITAWRDPTSGRWYEANDRVVVRADSLVVLNAGDRVIARANVHRFTNDNSYTRLMLRRGYAGVMNIYNSSILDIDSLPPEGLHLTAVERLGRLPRAGTNGVVRAMVVGERSFITPSMREAYSQSGLSHLLAVSGLHIGMLFLFVNLLLWFLPLLRRGHIVRNLIVIVVVWGYVVATGASPSAVRAALMCTILQISIVRVSAYVTMNAIATTALVMLVYRPSWLADISFQLSFVAVAGIVAWGVPLYKALSGGNRLVNLLTANIVVAMVASVATAPLVSHTFSIVAPIGIAINPIVIPLAGVVVLGGIVWVVMPVDFIAKPLGYIVSWAADAITSIAEWTTTLPYASFDLQISSIQMRLIYLLFVALTLVVWCRNPKKELPLRRL